MLPGPGQLCHLLIAIKTTPVLLPENILPFLLCVTAYSTELGGTFFPKCDHEGKASAAVPSVSSTGQAKLYPGVDTDETLTTDAIPVMDSWRHFYETI